MNQPEQREGSFLNKEKTNNRYAGFRREIGVLLRRNLAPVMGRRDATYDAAAAFAAGPCVFSQVTALLAMFRSAEKDSCDLLPMLSSPGTIEREQGMLEHIRELICLLQVLEAWNSSCKQHGTESVTETRQEDPVVMTVVSRLSSLIRHERPSLERYRAYASKNASPSYAEHYQKSYTFYLGINQSRLPALPPTVEN